MGHRGERRAARPENAVSALRTAARLIPCLGLSLAGCSSVSDPYAAWPAEGTYFPYIYTPQDDLEPYEEVRWETETWDPAEDLEMTAYYLLKSQNHRPGAPRETLDHFAQMREALPPLDRDPDLSFVGDVMWIGDNWAHYAEPAAHLLRGELRAGNLETPTSPDHPTVLADLGSYSFNAPPEMLDGLPLDLLQLNNNHSLDVEDLGLENTVAEVLDRDLSYTGVDRHAFAQVGEKTLALLSYTWGLNQRDAVTEHELFVIPFGHLEEVIDLAPLQDDVTAARADGAEVVVVLLHWGFEYEYYPDPHFLVLGRRIVAAGADLVVGHGPHVVQPPEICWVNHPEVVPGVGTCSVRSPDGEPRTAAILYSLGNFGTIMATVPCQVGLVASVTVGDGIGLGWSAVASVTGEDGPEIRALVDLLDDPELASEASRLDEHLGAHWRWSPPE